MFTKISNALMVRPGEFREIRYFVLLTFIIGAGMALGRGSADTLFFKRYGIEYLPIMYVFLGALLFVVTTLYATLVDRSPSEHSFKLLSIVLSIILGLCWLGMEFSQWENIYPVYFLVYEVASEILLVHSALYFSQNFDTQQSKRLIAIIMAGAQLGTIVGGSILAIYSHTIGVHNMLLLWIACLICAIFMIHLHHKKTGLSAFYLPGRKGRRMLKHAIEELQQGLRFARHSRLLVSMSFSLLFMVMTFYIISYSVNQVYSKSFTTEQELASFFGGLTAVFGLITLLLQVFVTNRFIKRLGLRNSNLLFPMMTIVSVGGLFSAFIFPMALLASFTKDVIMPAFRNPVLNLFYNALPNNIQGRSRALSIGLVLPLALVAAGSLLLLMQRVDDPRFYLGLGLIAALSYFFFSMHMNREYAQSLISHLKKKLFIPGDSFELAMSGNEHVVFDALSKAIRHKEPEIRFTASKTLLQLFPNRATPLVMDAITGMNPPLRDQLIRLLVPMDIEHLRQQLWNELENGDPHLRATIMSALFSMKDTLAKALVKTALADTNPRVMATGIYGALHYPLDELTDEALSRWHAMFNSVRRGENFAALDLFALHPESCMLGYLQRFLQSNEPRLLSITLKALSQTRNTEQLDFAPQLILLSQHAHFDIRAAAMECMHLLPKNICREHSQRLLNDSHPNVRKSAINLLFNNADQLFEYLIQGTASPKAQETAFEKFLDYHPDREQLKSLCHAKIDEVYTMLEQAHTLLARGHADSYSDTLLRTVIQERLQQMLNLCLLIAAHYDDAATVKVILAGLKSGDRTHLANSCDAAQYLQDKYLVRTVPGIMEQCFNFNGNIKQELSQEHHSATIEWWNQRNDPWLNDVINYWKKTTHVQYS